MLIQIRYTRLLGCLLAFVFLSNQQLNAQAVFQDKPFLQDYSVKYYFDKSNVSLTGVASDRNGVIQVFSSEGLLHPADGEFLHPGTLQSDQTYRFMKDMKLQAIGSQDQQLVYLSQKAVLSNAWAGKLYAEHQLPRATIFAGKPDLTFLVSDGSALQVVKDNKSLWKGSLPNDEVIGAQYQSTGNAFWILGKKSLYTLSVADFKLVKVLDGTGFTAFTLTPAQKVLIGTNDGYIEFDAVSKNKSAPFTENFPGQKLQRWVPYMATYGSAPPKEPFRYVLTVNTITTTANAGCRAIR